MWMKSWSNSTRASAIPDSRRPDIRIGRGHNGGVEALNVPPAQYLAPRLRTLDDSRLS